MNPVACISPDATFAKPVMLILSILEYLEIDMPCHVFYFWLFSSMFGLILAALIGGALVSAWRNAAAHNGSMYRLYDEL